MIGIKSPQAPVVAVKNLKRTKIVATAGSGDR